MNPKCAVGFHDWSRCKCSQCGKTREEGHDWAKDCESCSICGRKRWFSHSWDGCKCLRCGQTRDENHDWHKGCEKCLKCGKVGAHDWSKDCEKCATCNSTRSGSHEWQGCKCAKCHRVRDEQHDWSKDCEKCVRCGFMRSRTHKWRGFECSACGKKMESLDSLPSTSSTEIYGWNAPKPARAAMTLAEVIVNCGKEFRHSWAPQCIKCGCAVNYDHTECGTRVDGPAVFDVCCTCGARRSHQTNDFR